MESRFGIGPENVLFAGIIMCAYFSPEVLQAWAVKELINGKPKQRRRLTRKRRKCANISIRGLRTVVSYIYKIVGAAAMWVRSLVNKSS